MRLFFRMIPALVLLIICLCVYGSTSSAIFLDIPSLVLVLGVSILVLLTIDSPAGIINKFFQILFRNEIQFKEKEEYNTFLVLFEKSILSMGWGAFLIGIIQLMANLDKPEMIGPAVAVGLISPLYAFLVKALFINPALVKLNSMEPETDELDG